ncbi:MAG: hypothetical protein ACTSU2_04955 [Promethearchaeota archaeon]
MTEEVNKASKGNQVEEIRKLVMLLSDLRRKDNERYEEHVKFMNEVVAFISNIAKSMEENWKKIQNTLTQLNKTIEDNLNTLLTGINPEGLRETSNSLKEIVNTMSKSMQSMNLENVMRELRLLSGKGGVPLAANAAAPSEPEQISGQFGSPYSSEAEQEEEPEIYGYVPESMKKKKKKKEEDTHLLKPSDLFKH